MRFDEVLQKRCLGLSILISFFFFNIFLCAKSRPQGLYKLKYGVVQKEGGEELGQSVAILNLTAKPFEISQTKQGHPKRI